MAERAGFEPARRLLAYTLSKRAPSTARPPLLFNTNFSIIYIEYRYDCKKNNFNKFFPNW